MNRTKSASGVARRVLSLAIRSLPADREEWGRAMRAEFDYLDEPAARRRFAVGCLRVAISRRATVRAVVFIAATLAVLGVALGWASGIADPGVRTEALVLVLVLAVGSGSGLGIGYFGPVSASRSAHWVRGAGYAAVGALALSFIGSNRFPLGEPHADPAGWWIAALAVSSYLITTLVATAQTSPMNATVLAQSSMVGWGVASLWWLAMLLVPAVREQQVWGLLAVLVAMLASGGLATRRAHSAEQRVFAALLAGTVSCGWIFITAVGTYAMVPGLVPDVAGKFGSGGLTTAERVVTNRIESTDPYVVELLVGALLGAVLVIVLISTAIATARHRERVLRTDPTGPHGAVANSPTG